MPTAYVTAASAIQVLFTTPSVMKGKVTAINIDSSHAVSQNQIMIKDTFLPDASVANPTPTSTTQILISVPVFISGTTYNLQNINRLSLEDIETKGVVTAVGYSNDSGVLIFVNYHFDGQ
jgi:hypothetical protein